MSEFLSENFKKLTPYVPGEQPQDKKYIKLNTNESPYPPSDGVISAISKAETESLNLYPDPDCSRAKDTIAEKFGVKRENVFISNGSDETLSFAFMGFCDEKTPVIFPDISYGFYEVYAELYRIPYEKKPLNDDFTININDYLNANATVVIANPNAPTGLCLSVDDVEKIVRSNAGNVVVIDEAYVDFGGESCIPLVSKYDNLLVVQTYSKSRSLAGARLGFAIGHEKLISDLNTLKFSTNPYNINRLSLLAAEAAIKDEMYYDDKIKKIIEAREYTKSELEKMGFFVTDSKANFIFAKHSVLSGEEIYLKLKEAGILVRYFGTEKVKEYVRISIGTMEDMKTLVKTLDEILK